jgi:predicted RNase H-like nuclease (RuvC/YqgF family)
MTGNVSATTEARLRAAMQRLLDGTPQRTDGCLTKTNLAVEAGVSRATMNRATGVLDDWNQQVTDRAPRIPSLQQALEENRDLKRTIKDLRAQNRDLTTKLTAAATVIAELDAQLASTRPDSGVSTPINLSTRRPRRR